MTIAIRSARQRDVPQLVSLLEQRRAEYQVLAPLFWKKAARSAVWTTRFFRFLLFTRRATFLVAEENDVTICGLLVAVRARVPPVFDPGPTIFVDDFYVNSPARWSDVGQALIDRLRTICKERGWTQLIVVSGTGDQPKNAFLRSIGLADTSSWWSAPV